MAEDEIDTLIERLLADPAHHGHPLREALALLWEQYLGQVQRLDRIARISDRVQWAERRHELARTAQFEKRLRQLEKMTRISDRYQDMLREANLALQQASTHDALTGLPNRRLLTERLPQEIARCGRQGLPLCVALLDIDHFKQVNDQHGHDAGDRALRAVAQAIADLLREYDMCGRWGGEEFLLLLPGLGLDEATGVAARIFEALRELPIDGLPTDQRISVSMGLTAWHPGERPEDAIARADRALLDAKRSGRSQLKTLA